MRPVYFFILFCLTLVACQTDKEPTTLVIVRHAEKITTGDDPGLTSVGQDRADRLAQILERQSIAAVYSTPYIRTRLTGAPTAMANDLEVIEYDPSSAEAFLNDVLSKHSGETVLITGHSNTVPAMVNLLSGSTLEDFEDSDYGNIFVITGSELGSCSSVNLFY